MKFHSAFSFALYVTAGAAAFSMIPWLCGIAYAAADPVAAVTSSLGWPEWLGIGLAALAGVKALVDGALGFFRYLAPKTKTTVDDAIRDDLQLAHDKLDDLTALVQGIAKPVAVTVQNVVPANSVTKTGDAL